jgi:hypothetical protein
MLFSEEACMVEVAGVKGRPVLMSDVIVVKLPVALNPW